MAKNDKSETGLAVYNPPPVEIKTGYKYDYLVGQHITQARVEKIFQAQDGTYMLVITVWSPDDWAKKATATVDLTQFKLNLLKGGVDKIVI